VGRGENRVDLTWIEDVARGHADALEVLLRGEAAGRAYFLTQDEPVALWPFVREILQRAGLPAPGRAVPFPVAWAAGAVAEGLWAVTRRPGEPPMTRFVAHELAEDHWFSSRAAREAFGYRPRVRMAEGLERYFAEERAEAGGEPAETTTGSPS
jgi:nucleoside-diphosphate-sugar epimerase